VKTRVCIADALTIFRSGVREVLQREKDFAVLEATNLESFDAVLDASVDIALIDAELPPFGAGAAIELAKGRCPQIIVWSLRASSEEVLATVRQGATGYLRKEISALGLVRSLRGVSQGESPLSRDLAALLIDALHSDVRGSRAREIAAALSAREREVLEHVVRGARNKQIADALTISEFTVKRHVQNILHKLELPSRRAVAEFYGANLDAMAAVERVGV